ncbi:hypothetical protein NEUTE1DRAFT_44038, partial [Neurospora tetrasperma FGSC 2508]
EEKVHRSFESESDLCGRQSSTVVFPGRRRRWMEEHKGSWAMKEEEYVTSGTETESDSQEKASGCLLHTTWQVTGTDDDRPPSPI